MKESAAYVFLLLPCKSTQGWLICDDSHSPEALNQALPGLIKDCPGWLSDRLLFFFRSLVSISAALSFVSQFGMSAWEFSRCGFGCGGKDKDEHPPGCLPAACSLPVRQRNTCGKVTADHGWRGRESGLSQHLQRLLPSPLCTQLSHEIIIPIYCSHGLHLDIISQYWQICVCFLVRVCLS